jgi:hypothetical protein
MTSLRTWAGILEELFTRIITALGNTPQSIKQIALIPYRIWDRSICEIPEQPHPYIDQPLSVGPSPVEWGAIRSFRRAARMISSLPPDKEYCSPATDNEEHWGPPPLQELKPTLKLSDLVNPKCDHNVIPLRISTVSAMYERYSKTVGRDTPEDSSPTTDQIAAIKMLYDLRAAPGVEFSLFGPHGNHAISKPTYAAQRWDGETQSYKVRFLPGPSDFDTWFRSWKVFKYTCLLIGSCKTESLDAYSNHLRSLNQEHGQRHWFIILQADFDLRSKIFLKWVHGEENRQRARITFSELWDFFFRAAADPYYPSAKRYWKETVLQKAHTYPSIFNHSQSTICRVDTVNLPQEGNVYHNNDTTGRLWPLHPWIPSEGYGKQQVPHINPEPRRSSPQTERSQVSSSSNRGTHRHIGPYVSTCSRPIGSQPQPNLSYHNTKVKNPHLIRRKARQQRKKTMQSQHQAHPST